MIRVLIVEDHFLARMALRAVIEQTTDITVSAETDNANDALTLYRQHTPDVVIMDLRLPGPSGLDAIANILRDDPRARVLVLTNFTGSEDVFRAVQAGARGYLTKDAGANELVEGIRRVNQGLRHFSPAAMGCLAERIGASEMTPRELEVLGLLARGMSNRSIAEELKIVEKTARIHVSSILEKLGVDDRTQAVLAALHRGIVHLD